MMTAEMCIIVIIIIKGGSQRPQLQNFQKDILPTTTGNCWGQTG